MNYFFKVNFTYLFSPMQPGVPGLCQSWCLSPTLAMLHLLWIPLSEEVPSPQLPSAALPFLWPNFEEPPPSVGCHLSVGQLYFELPAFSQLVLCWQASPVFHYWPRVSQVFPSPGKFAIKGRWLHRYGMIILEMCKTSTSSLSRSSPAPPCSNLT